MDNASSKRRGYLLPKGCKDLIDVLKLKEAKTTRAGSKLLVNGQIKAPQVRIVEYRGRQLGIMPIAAALNLAVEKRLDLVLVAPTANPPVCCLIDYAAYRARKRKA
jgi:translation initiation factor IF-3